MAQPTIELEGTWEEIQERSGELAGHRVKVVVYPATHAGQQLSERNQQMLKDLEELRAEELTPEEIQVLDEFEQFRKDHPFTLRHFDIE